MHPGALLEVAEQRYETSVKEVVRWGDCILVLHMTACSNCHSTGQAAPRFPSTNHLTQPSPQAGCSSARSPGFVLVGIHFHLVSYTEEPEIRKMLFQIGKKKKKNSYRITNTVADLQTQNFYQAVERQRQTLASVRLSWCNWNLSGLKIIHFPPVFSAF